MSRAGNHNMALRLEPAAAAAAVADVDEDELFELDIALLDGRGHHSSRSAAVAGDGDDAAGGHALLANCLLPVRSVSNAVPVAASSVLSSSYPYSGYHSSRRLIFAGGGGGGWRFLGRSAGSSARLCFSGRGFETMGNYFQRY
ncbi:uncharacterized protein LOC120684421 [Panicum virgatum]|uniref:Uncharacterized protein n=1 Tax=Panicum virgatum TaxID=38727 RepID=A0A8T0P6P1_PANVG|nr:uncharacterized protein LOC120684421 [Panicum virgatum]KAG2555842.1 hypothetical protein PVAP13_8NG054800 [Panicum virgatum]